jgi:hypothetical protein
LDSGLLGAKLLREIIYLGFQVRIYLFLYKDFSKKKQLNCNSRLTTIQKILRIGKTIHFFDFITPDDNEFRTMISQIFPFQRPFLGDLGLKERIGISSHF